MPLRSALVAALLAAGLALGMRLPPLDIDAAQYAAIAMEMLQRGDWLTVTERGADYLDKPPLVFWTASASYAVFGIHAWTYKLPSALWLVLALVSVVRLGRVLYDERETGTLGAWVLAATVGAALMIEDPRTDTLLMGSVAFATWQWAAWLRRGGWGPLLLGALGMGVGMLAKGPIGVVAPGFALFADVLVHNRWRRLLDARLLVAPVVIALVLAPMLVGLHRQFGMRGLEFFFWTQSFGRVTGASTWANDTTPLYFTHTFLWTFAPWAPMTLAALWQAGRGWASADAATRADARCDALVIGGFALSLAALSLSRYKLPHYAYVSFPFAALLAGRALARWGAAVPTAMRALVLGTAGLLLVAVVALSTWAFPVAGAAWWAGAAASVAAAVAVWRAPRSVRTLPVATAALVASVLWLGNGHVAPRLFAYQSESIAGDLVREARVPAGDFVALATHRPSLDFAARRVVPELPDTAAVRAALTGRASDRPLWVWARFEELPALSRIAARVDTVALLPWFGISRANARFLNPQTRDAMTDTWGLVRLVPAATFPATAR